MYCLGLIQVNLTHEEITYFWQLEYELTQKVNLNSDMSFDKFFTTFNLINSSELITTKINRLEAQLQQTQVKLERSQSQLQNTQYELERSQIMIAAMESSKFWQIRTVWFNFRRAIGLVNANVSFRQSLFSRAKYLLPIFRAKGFSYGFDQILKKKYS
ncbi:hypothetical protein [Nostoc piscinale]|nr:hypothetical protein [Nostoc piscinale]